MNIGLLGFGSMGKTHAYAIAALPYYYHPLPFRAQVAGVCTTDAERSAQIAEEYGFARGYPNAAALINDPNIDAVSICTPNYLHFSQITACLEAGKSVYCEKPLCITAEQAWQVAKLAKERGLTCQTVFQNRFLGAVMRAKELIDAGRLGRILTFRFAYLHASCTDPEKAAGWKQDREICGGGVLFDLGSHVLDLCTHLCGAVCAIGGVSQIGFPIRKGRSGEEWKTNADEAFYMTLRMQNGAVGSVEASKLATGSMDELTFSIHGERGALRFSLMDPHYLAFFDRSRQEIEEGFVRIPCGGRQAMPGGRFPSYKAASGWLRGHVGSMYAFLSACSSGCAAEPSFAQGAYVQQLMETAMRSDEQGGGLLPVCLSKEEADLCRYLA